MNQYNIISKCESCHLQMNCIWDVIGTISEYLLRFESNRDFLD